MNYSTLIRLLSETDAARRLNGEAESLAGRPRMKRGLLLMLAAEEQRLATIHRLLLEAALAELLWQYLDCVAGSDTECVVRQLIADIAAKSAE